MDNIKIEMPIEMIESDDKIKTNNLIDKVNELTKIDASTIPSKPSFASKFNHIIIKKNIIIHNMNKNNNKKRFDSSDYYMKKHADQQH